MHWRLFFFEHKYLTMPTLTRSIVLLKAANDLMEAINGKMAKSEAIDKAAKVTMQVFKQKAVEEIQQQYTLVKQQE